MWDGAHTTWPCSLGGYKENISFPEDTALLKENRLGLIGDASMELDSLVFIEMTGFWNNRGQTVVFTIRVKVDIMTIMGQSGIQGAPTHRALWQWLVGHRARKMDNQPGCCLICMIKNFIFEGSLPLYWIMAAPNVSSAFFTRHWSNRNSKSLEFKIIPPCHHVY